MRTAKALGYLRDEPKGKGSKPDWQFADIRNSAASTPITRKSIVQVRDQLQLGSCVGQAIVSGIQAKTQEEPGAAMWVYLNARSYKGMIDFDCGCDFRSALRGINDFGLLPERVYSYGYDITKFADKPSRLDTYQANDNKQPLEYYRISNRGDQRIRDCELALADGNPVWFGTDVTRAFTKDKGYDWNDPIGAPKAHEIIAGGHGMLLCEQGDGFFWGLSSWGLRWALGGFFKMSYDYVKWPGTSDLWVPRNVPRFAR